MQVVFEIMVQNTQKRGIGVETPSPRSFLGGLEWGCYTSGLPLRAAQSRTLGAKDSSICICTCWLHGNKGEDLWYNDNKNTHTCMPTYLHTYIPKIPTNPTYYYRQTYRLMPTNKHITATKERIYDTVITKTHIPACLHTYIHTYLKIQQTLHTTTDRPTD